MKTFEIEIKLIINLNYIYNKRFINIYSNYNGNIKD